MSTEQLKSILGSPDDSSSVNRISVILKYGILEFTFTESELWLIAFDLYAIGPTQDSIQLPAGLFPAKNSIPVPRSQEAFVRDLESLNIPYALDEKLSTEDHLLWNVGTCVQVVFDVEFGAIAEAQASRKP